MNVRDLDVYILKCALYVSVCLYSVKKILESKIRTKSMHVPRREYRNDYENKRKNILKNNTEQIIDCTRAYTEHKTESVVSRVDRTIAFTVPQSPVGRF